MSRALFFKNFAGKGVKPVASQNLSEADFVQFVVSERETMEKDEKVFLTKQCLDKALKVMTKVILDSLTPKQRERYAEAIGVDVETLHKEASLTSHGNKVVRGDKTGELYATVYLKPNGVVQADF